MSLEGHLDGELMGGITDGAGNVWIVATCKGLSLRILPHAYLTKEKRGEQPPIYCDDCFNKYIQQIREGERTGL